jgi:hypothetical protein
LIKLYELYLQAAEQGQEKEVEEEEEDMGNRELEGPRIG